MIEEESPQSSTNAYGATKDIVRERVQTSAPGRKGVEVGSMLLSDTRLRSS